MNHTSSVETRHNPAAPNRARQRLRIPPNAFGIPFGLAGLADVWDVARPTLGTPAAVANTMYVVSAAVWLVILAAYLRQGPRHALSDLRDDVVGPFVSLAVITPLLDSAALGPYSTGTAQTLVVVFLALTVAIGWWLTGEWISGGHSLDRAHAGYYLPTVAGGLVGAFAAAAVHLHALAAVSFGLGIISWVMLGSFTLARLFFQPLPPAPLIPTLAVLIAPPAVGGVAYFFLTAGATGPVAEGLAGYTILMVITQLRLVPVYARLRFSLATWAFTFSYAAVGTDAILWIAADRPAGATAYTAIVTGLVTLFMAAIALRTVLALGRRQLFPVPPS